MTHYGYFVLLRDAQLHPAGEVWNPNPDFYKTGDSLGVKNGIEGVVAAVVKGAGAMRKGFEVLVIVDQLPAAGLEIRCLNRW
jgi:hypothetical protein